MFSFRIKDNLKEIQKKYLKGRTNTMKNLVAILKHIFTPFSAFAFLLLGLMACFCSAVIEFFVFKELLTIPDLKNSSGALAAFIVLVLEGSKFTLHFYNESLKKRGLENEISEFDVAKKRKLICLVKNTLVILSVVCSLICFTNILYDNSQEKIKNAVEINTEECEKHLQEELKKLESTRITNINNKIESLSYMQDSIKSEEARLNNLDEQIRNEMYINKRKDLIAEADNCRKNINSIRTQYNSEINKITLTEDQNYEKEKEQLELKYGENGSERISKVDLDILSEGDNKYLKGFLLAFTMTFFNRTYSRSTYFIFAITIGLALALVLELCISISQMLLSISVDSFMKIIGEIPSIGYAVKIARRTTWFLISVLINTAMYLITCIILGISANPDTLKIVLFTYVITTFLVNILIPKENITPMLENTYSNSPKLEIISKSLKHIFVNMCIPAILAFVGYMLIGFFCKGNFIYKDLNGLAIAIGGSFAKMINFDNCDFLI